MRLDDDEIRRTYAPRRTRSSAELFGVIFLAVVLGILAADGARLLILNAWANYQLEQMQRAIKEGNEQARREAQAARERMDAAAHRQAYDAKFNSVECKFWRGMHQQEPNEKTRRGIANSCP